MAAADLVFFQHQPILAALKESPGGVVERHEGVRLSAPYDVAVAMKQRNAIIYNRETQQYQAFSKAHQTALKTYTPRS